MLGQEILRQTKLTHYQKLWHSCDKHLSEVLQNSKLNVLIVTTREQEFASISHLIRGTKIHPILDYADIVNLSEVQEGVKIFKAGKGGASTS
jgi:hypothetical protein